MHAFNVTPGQLKAALLFAGKNDVRFYLNGILLERGHDYRRMVATDGHRLICINLPHPPSEDPEHDAAPPPKGSPLRYIVPREAVEQAIKAFGKNNLITVRCDGKNVVLEGIKANLLDANFPGYERIIPTEASGEYAGFNALYLADCVKASQLLSPSKLPHPDRCQCAPNGDGPAFVHLSDDAFCVIMSVRDAKLAPAGVPNWYSNAGKPRDYATITNRYIAKIKAEGVTEYLEKAK